MMGRLQVVYSIFVPSGRVRTLLDAIRLFANPAARHPAHVTVRGPYPDYLDPRDWSAKVAGQMVDVGGVGRFLGGEKSTVFLRAESPTIRAVWDKPDYPDEFNPHLSIYSDRDKGFAERLHTILAECDPRFSFLAGGLEPMVVGNGPGPLLKYYNPSALAAVLQNPPAAPAVAAADADTRLGWIAALAEQLSEAGCGAV